MIAVISQTAARGRSELEMVVTDMVHTVISGNKTTEAPNGPFRWLRVRDAVCDGIGGGNAKRINVIG